MLTYLFKKIYNFYIRAVKYKLFKQIYSGTTLIWTARVSKILVRIIISGIPNKPDFAIFNKKSIE